MEASDEKSELPLPFNPSHSIEREQTRKEDQEEDRSRKNELAGMLEELLQTRLTAQRRAKEIVEREKRKVSIVSMLTAEESAENCVVEGNTGSIAKKRSIRKQSKQGRWLPIEHERFLEGLRIYGRNWKKVEKYVGTRSGTQVRSHAQKYFLKHDKEGSEPLSRAENTFAGKRKNSDAKTIIEPLQNENKCLKQSATKETSDQQYLSTLMKLQRASDCLSAAVGAFERLSLNKYQNEVQYTKLSAAISTLILKLQSIFKDIALEPKLCSEWSKIMKEARNTSLKLKIIQESAAEPKKKEVPTECQFLFEYMQKVYNIKGLAAVGRQFVRLGDWISPASQARIGPRLQSNTLGMHAFEKRSEEAEPISKLRQLLSEGGTSSQISFNDR